MNFQNFNQNLDIEYFLNTINTRNSDFRILLINARSIRNKLDKIELLINEFDLLHKSVIHAVIITESWLYENEICEIENYKAFHSTRGCLGSGRGGGVSIFILKNISCQCLLNLCFDESNFLIIELIKEKIKIMGIYTPGRNVETFLDKLDSIISLHNM